MTKEYILNLHKEIQSNGCWLYTLQIKRDSKKRKNGYAYVYLDGKYFYLHRLVLCIWFGFRYEDYTWQANHIIDCPNRNCFNPEHLQKGTNSSNMDDAVLNKTHVQSRKTTCPKGHLYDSMSYGHSKNSHTRRTCSICRNESLRRNRKKRKANILTVKE